MPASVIFCVQLKQQQKWKNAKKQNPPLPLFLVGFSRSPATGEIVVQLDTTHIISAALTGQNRSMTNRTCLSRDSSRVMVSDL